MVSGFFRSLARGWKLLTNPTFKSRSYTGPRYWWLMKETQGCNFVYVISYPETGDRFAYYRMFEEIVKRCLCQIYSTDSGEWVFLESRYSDQPYILIGTKHDDWQMLARLQGITELSKYEIICDAKW